MLLTETIKNSITAIEKYRVARENEQSDECHTKALSKLSQQHNTIKNILDCAKEMKKKGIVEQPVLKKSVRDDLLVAVQACGSAINDGNLTIDTVTVLQAKGESCANQLKLTWKDSATKYAEGTRGYLSIISGLTDDPQKARKLGDSINKNINDELSINAINKLVADVKEAKKIANSFSINPSIEVFLKKVSSQQATVADLTPDIMQWLTDKKLLSKLKVSFI